MKLTVAMVACAKCRTCSALPYRKELDEGGTSLNCDWCYEERCKAEADLLRNKKDAIWRIDCYFGRMENLLYQNQNDYVEMLTKLRDNLREYQSAVADVLKATDADRVKKLREYWDERAFPDKKGGRS